MCFNCNNQISTIKIIIKGDPCNTALAAYWNMFTISKAQKMQFMGVKG
jgi:hypothetical protein